MISGIFFVMKTVGLEEGGKEREIRIGLRNSWKQLPDPFRCVAVLLSEQDVAVSVGTGTISRRAGEVQTPLLGKKDSLSLEEGQMVVTRRKPRIGEIKMMARVNLHDNTGLFREIVIEARRR
jgi:hypothetical protein